MKSRKSLKFKLITIFLGVAIVPMLAAVLSSSMMANKEIKIQATERARMIGTDKAHQIGAYFTNELDSFRDLAASSTVKAAISELATAMQSYEHSAFKAEHQAKVTEFYEKSFNIKYGEMNEGKKTDVRGWIGNLDPIALNGQFDFIANNTNPLGEKGNLFNADREVPYNVTHAKYHEELGSYVKRHGLYDIFLVSPQGRVVYTYFKEIDFATDLVKGPLAASGLGQAFAHSKDLAEGAVHMQDFAPYLPSYEAPASFASTPIFKGGVYLGTLLIQFPLDKISAVAADREGLGERGQVLLLGDDGLLRADAFRQKDKYNVAAAFKNAAEVKIDSPMIADAAAGKSGLFEGNSYDGEKILAYFRPLKIANESWVVITELSQDEVFTGANQLRLLQWIILGVAIVLITAVAWRFSIYIGLKLRSIIDRLSTSATQVSKTSSESENSSGQLSSAVTQQASSLQQTMASAEQISAMISQNADSASKAKATVEANDQATREGSNAVQEMVHAISEISATNDKILHQMESSNREFSEIVNIISEIGDKTKVINDIVFQTKLLSFNASVEAARAGEHGKGFAVVAEEVGNLAQMSGNAAKEITNMLTTSIKRVNSIVEQTKSRVEELVEVGRDKVSTGQSTANRCKSALDLLGRNAATLTAMVTEIAHASKEQAQGVKEINAAIAQLDQVTQQNSVVAQHSSAQAADLMGETSSLQQIVGELAGFVNGDGAGAAGHRGQAVEPVADGKRPRSGSAGRDSVRRNSEASDQGLDAREDADFGRVVKLRAKGSNAAEMKNLPGTRAQASKRVAEKLAAGSDVVPSADNPKFEDF